ncbi:M20/M25/M40 family metallo-hydrolase [Allokutzneria multivorans]|uniref:M20/M25/M40 family metallo-hydrolase n=1 Tax=Allokutzneria multivorans TaxID=1142134 RepID=A0ABP7R179_9PSEU
MNAGPPTDDVRARILAAVDDLRDEMTTSLQQLVRVPSVNPKYPGVEYREHVGKEGEGSAVLAELYERAGAEVELFAVEAGRENAVARLGGGEGRSLIFNGHVDVVPGGDPAEWQVAPPFAGEVVGSRMYGRGTTDQKSGLIGQAYAAIALRRAGIQLAGELQLQCAVGEETVDYTCGTGAIVERGYTAEAAIVSEPSAPPTPVSLAVVSPGLLWFSVTVEGIKVHCSMRGETIHPHRAGEELGVNAIDKIFTIYQALRGLEQEWVQTQRHPLFYDGHFSLLPGVIRGAPGDLAVPFALSDSATIEYTAMFHPERDGADVRAEIQGVIDRAADSDPWLRKHRPVCEWKLQWDPYSIEPGADINTTLAAAYKEAAVGTRFAPEPTFTGFYGGCDATVLKKLGIPSVVLGPGDLRVAHANDEYVDLDEMWLAARTYALVAADWCGVKP